MTREELRAMGLPDIHPAACECGACDSRMALERRRETCEHEFGPEERTFLGRQWTCRKCGLMQGQSR